MRWLSGKHSSHQTKFFTKAGIFYLLWWFIYHVLQAKWGGIDRFVINLQTSLAHQLLLVLDYKVAIALDDKQVYFNRLWIDGSSYSLEVASNCNGMELIGIFAVFIIAYQSTWRAKLFLLPGITLIFLLNILRITALVLINFYAPQFMDFNHKYIFTSLMYLIIALLWWLWLNKKSAMT